MSAPRVAPAHSFAPRALRPAGFLLLAALAGCGPATRVRVVNASGGTLDSLVLAGEAWRMALRPLAAGESLEVSAPVRGEDVLALRGRGATGRLAPGMGLYVETGAGVRMVVDSTGFVRTRARVAD